MANWYKELKELNENIEFIVVRENVSYYDEDDIKPTQLSGSLEDVKSVMDYDFDDGYGGINGPFFTAWTKDKVYFPICYDGAEWIGNVPRNPCNEATEHLGGG